MFEKQNQLTSEDTYSFAVLKKKEKIIESKAIPDIACSCGRL